jgi:pyruvate,water dikinase
MLKRLGSFLRNVRQPKTRVSPDSLNNVFHSKYERFKELLDSNSELATIISEIEEKLQGYEVFGMAYIRSVAARAIFHALRMVGSFDALSNGRYPALHEVFDSINSAISQELRTRQENGTEELVLPYSRVTMDMVDWVGGKNANLGEMKNRVHLPVPDGFAITTRAFGLFLAETTCSTRSP